LSTGDYKDFYLAAQRVTQGTCTLTHYTVIHQSEEIDMGPIIKFTVDQCFNYFNWPGAVRVPACLQYANKLATLMG
jgi:aubergine